MNKHFPGICSFLLLASFVLTASVLAGPAPEDEKLEEIFSGAVKAVGGEKAVGKIRSIEAFADCVGPQGRYTTELVSFQTDKTVFRQTFTYRDEDRNIFINNGLAWEKASGTGEFSLVSPFQKLVVHLHEYQKLAFGFQKMFRNFELVGEETFETRPSVKVRAENELGGEIFLFFDRETKLLSGYVLPVPNTNESVKNVFDEWKRVGNVKLPSVVTATDSAGEWVLRFTKITLNKTPESLPDVPPRVSDLAELMKLHEQAKTAHLTYNAGLFIEMFAENLTQLQGGNVTTRSRAENLERFKNYFSNYKFIEWEDIKPPVIKISKDGTLATVIVEKRVRGTYKNEKGAEETDHTVFAWLEVWEKTGGKWKVVTVASTSKSGKTKE